MGFTIPTPDPVEDVPDGDGGASGPIVATDNAPWTGKSGAVLGDSGDDSDSDRALELFTGDLVDFAAPGSSVALSTNAPGASRAEVNTYAHGGDSGWGSASATLTASQDHARLQLEQSDPGIDITLRCSREDALAEILAGPLFRIRLPGTGLDVAGIDGSATPTTAAELADVLVNLGVIASHTVSAAPPPRYSRPTDATTRANSSLGSLAVPWTDSITTTVALPKVDYRVIVSAQCSSDETIFMALACDGVIIDRRRMYTQSGAYENYAELAGFHTPSTGAHTYEVYVASNSGGTITVNTSVDTNAAASTTADGVSSMKIQLAA